jgi:hypothetical protein
MRLFIFLFIYLPAHARIRGSPRVHVVARTRCFRCMRDLMPLGSSEMGNTAF